MPLHAVRSLPKFWTFCGFACTRMKRFHQFVLVISFLLVCWLAMMTVHEFGHVLAAWGTGGTVTRVVLHPFAISRTDVSPILSH
jgi:hypothetical protein